MSQAVATRPAPKAPELLNSLMSWFTVIGAFSFMWTTGFLRSSSRSTLTHFWIHCYCFVVKRFSMCQDWLPLSSLSTGNHQHQSPVPSRWALYAPPGVAVACMTAIDVLETEPAHIKKARESRNTPRATKKYLLERHTVSSGLNAPHPKSNQHLEWSVYSCLSLIGCTALPCNSDTSACF